MKTYLNTHYSLILIELSSYLCVSTLGWIRALLGWSSENMDHRVTVRPHELYWVVLRLDAWDRESFSGDLPETTGWGHQTEGTKAREPLGRQEPQRGSRVWRMLLGSKVGLSGSQSTKGQQGSAIFCSPRVCLMHGWQKLGAASQGMQSSQSLNG